MEGERRSERERRGEGKGGKEVRNTEGRKGREGGGREKKTSTICLVVAYRTAELTFP